MPFKNNYQKKAPAKKRTYKKKQEKYGPFGKGGQLVGQGLASAIGLPSGLGRRIGGALGHGVGKLFGSGAYRFNPYGRVNAPYMGQHKMFRGVIKGSGAYDLQAAPSAVTSSNAPPSFGSNRTIITHREFISDVYSSTSYNITKYDINPGLEETFPWLSSIAANYEKYRPIGIVFEFKSTSANALNSTNTALGTVIMAARYNAVSTNIPQSKMEIEQIENVISVCPAESALCGIECANQFNPLNILYVRTGDVPSGQSEQFFDVADFYIATQGMQAANVIIGELWVTYQMELITPVLEAGQLGNTINYAQYTLGSGVSTSAYFGTNPSNSLNIHTMTLTLGTNTITFQSNIVTGVYEIIYYVRGVSTAGVTAVSVTTTSNCRFVNNFVGNTSPIATAGGTVANMLFICTIEITGASAVLTFSGGVFPSTISGGDLIVTQLPGELGN